jgi:uncharacterized protein YndB with AHSA1/START domain
MSTASMQPLTGTVTVDVPIEQAFRIFTESISSWWPNEYHIGAADMAEPVLEPRMAGRWYERGVDGSECDWGRILVWEPPTRLVLTWQINGRWQFDPDPEHASEIEVRFRADGREQTIVDLEHRLIERLSDGHAIRATISEAGGGWGAILQLYAKTVQNSTT